MGKVVKNKQRGKMIGYRDFSFYHQNAFTKGINTQYGCHTTIVFTLKMQSVSEITIFGRKMMVKSGLEQIFLKSLHAKIM